jgi:plastocyanin
MCAHHEKEGQGHGYNNLTGVAWSILVMGLSLAAVIVLWVWFGYIGPTFSEDVLSNQQRTLREHFGLPVQEISDDPEVLQTPPSLRNIGQDLEANTSNNSATTTVTTATNATTNDTSKEGAVVQSETTAGGTTITIPSGASVQGNPDYEPDEAEVPLNGNIVWVNKDTVPHTATSGTGAEDPNSGKIFDTSIINGGEESSPVQITGVKEGDEIPYYCQVHPYMTSKLTVGAASAASAGGPTTASGPTAGNASSAGGAGGGNATTAPTTSTTAAPSATTTTTTAAAATLTIPQGASVQGNPAYEPDPLTVKVGDTIAVNNKDIAPHTVTNGKDATDPNMGKLFDTSIINAGDSAEIVTTGMKPGEYPYHCSVHPYMTGTMTVQ